MNEQRAPTPHVYVCMCKCKWFGFLFFVKPFAISYVGYAHILLYILKLLQLLTLHLASASAAACVNEMGRLTCGALFFRRFILGCL